jgi:light-regulated signal transduction histidine kinase (bacteriophytochrome)
MNNNVINFSQLSKLNEINQILKPNIKDVVRDIKKQYKDKLEGFKELKTIDKLDEMMKDKKKLFIRSIDAINNKINYGGFLYKYDDKNLTLINKNRKPWIIEVNKNFIFYNIVLSDNERTRKSFEEFLLKNNNNVL